MAKATITQSNNSNRNWIFWIVLFAFFCLAVYTLKSVLLPFVTGILIGYLFDPLATKFEKMGINRSIATLLVLLSCLIILVPAIILLFSVIDEQISRFIVSLPEYTATFLKKVEPFLQNLQDTFPNLNKDKIREYIQNNTSNSAKVFGVITQKILSGGFAILNTLSLLLITPVVTFYMLRDWHTFLGKVKGLLPQKNKETILNVSNQIDRTIAGFIRGQLSVCLIEGCIYAICLHFIGLELGILLGFMAGLLAFIPFVGGLVSIIVCFAIAFAQFHDITPLLQIAASFAFVQVLENNFFVPKLVGKSIGLHPVWIIFALLSGGILLGFLGIMLAVPLAAIIGVLVRFSIENYKKSNLYLRS